MKGVLKLSRDLRTGSFVPGGLRCTDLRRLRKKFVRVMAVYRKDAADERCTEVLHSSKRIDWDKIRFSDGYEYLPLPRQKHDSYIKKSTSM